MTRAKVCVVCQKYQLSREYLSFHTALEKKFDLTRYFVDDGWPRSIDDLPGGPDYDAVIWFVRFRELMTRPAFDWGSFRGMRVLHDQDAYMNFSPLATNRYLGLWPKVYRANRFDVLICTGRRTRDNLLEAGVNAVWVPKAYDPSRFFPKNGVRNGICYFGELYRARLAMLTYVRKTNIAVTRFRCSYFELNDFLNRFSICLICNMVGSLPAGPARILNRIIPSYGIRVSEGPEVMLKNFEVAGSGCVPFCDEIPELDELGFKDAETMVSYRNFDELAEKLIWYQRVPDKLCEISVRAATLCQARHTWDHRADSFAEIIAGRTAR